MTLLMLQTQLAAYPVLLPLYMMRFDWKFPFVPDKVPITCIMQAHSKDVGKNTGFLLYLLGLTICAGFGVL
jgi:hypothetical protein